MSRAQFEIMGLAIVMVLVSIGIFFVIALSINDPGTDAAGQFVTDQFSQNLLDAFLKSTHPACPDDQVQDYFLYNATKSGPDECRQASTWEQLNQTLNQSIKQYIGREYYFSVRRDVCDGPMNCANNEEELRSGECDPRTATTGRAGRQTIPKYPQTGDVEIILWLCAAQ